MQFADLDVTDRLVQGADFTHLLEESTCAPGVFGDEIVQTGRQGKQFRGQHCADRGVFTQRGRDQVQYAAAHGVPAGYMG